MEADHELRIYENLNPLWELECSFCGETESIACFDRELAARGFLEDGWQYVEWDEYQQEGIACPACIQERNTVDSNPS